MSRPVITETGTRSRTRRAILGAAASELARNPAATLAEIAEAAEVGRTTLHRYFPDRATLHRAVIDDSYRAIEQAVADARADEGPPLAALHRLVTAFVEVGDRILFLFYAQATIEEYAGDTDPDPAASAVLDLVRRGQSAGVFATDLSPEWIENVLWSLVYTGCEVAKDGKIPRSGVAAIVLRTLEHGIRAGG